MYQPITVVKIRSPLTVKIPAGGWLLLGSPEEPLSDQINRRAAIIKDGQINDDYEQLVIGRISDTHPVLRFVTAAQAAEHAKNQSANDKNLTASAADARARQQQMESAKAAEAEKHHQAQVAALNRQHDLMRNRARGTAPVQAEISAASANEFNREDLNKKDRGELISLATALFETKRLDILPDGKKSDLVEAILSARPVAAANV